MEAFFFSERFLTIEILSDIVSTFTWPESYQLIDELPDCIKMVFPKCTLLFIEGAENEISIKLDKLQTGTEYSLDLNTVLYYVFIPEAKNASNFSEPRLVNDFSIPGSISKLKNQIFDNCILLQAYFLPCIRGDFSWVEKYKENTNREWTQ